MGSHLIFSVPGDPVGSRAMRMIDQQIDLLSLNVEKRYSDCLFKINFVMEYRFMIEWIGIILR